MKTLFVLACILVVILPLEASSSESKERRYFNRFCPPCPPCPQLADYPPVAQPPFSWPFYQPIPGAPLPPGAQFLPGVPLPPGAPFPPPPQG
uniref:Follicular dendritic cell secreted peptide-like protein n=1 Tax=Tarentola mauritanica TaxID=8569 RepID=A0A0K1HS22_TARMA|nr:follicular dendritic cell secreted peptide-like protein [Tarentola mauritanica]